METLEQIGAKEIAITEIENIWIGHAQNAEGATGCSVIISKDGMPAGVDVRGGGPAGRETELLKPVAACDKIHALMLSGGSAYGLDAATGVMKYLEERKIGFNVGTTVVPLVCASCLFDLALVTDKIRPDAAMGYEACKNAENSNCKSGNIGAGCGATVGKIYGEKQMMKAGLGCYAIQYGALKIGAMIALNSLGDVYDHRTGKKLAGLLNKEHTGFLDTQAEMAKTYTGMEELYAGKPVGNTAIGAVITNALFSKTQMNKIAAHAQNGLARCVKPVHTMADGDSIYALSTGSVKADMDVVGILSAEVLSEAIRRAVMDTKGAYGYPCASDLL